MPAESQRDVVEETVATVNEQLVTLLEDLGTDEVVNVLRALRDSVNDRLDEFIDDIVINDDEGDDRDRGDDTEREGG